MKETKGWMRPHELDRRRERDSFDPVVEGSRYGLSRELSQAIWDRVCTRATHRIGRLDVEQAKRRFHEIAARIAARGGRLHADAGRLTRVDTEQGSGAGSSRLDELTTRTPGRQTLVAAEARRWGSDAAIDAAIDEMIDGTIGASSAAPDAGTPSAHERTENDDGNGRETPLAADRRLPIATLERMEQAFGQRFDDVEIHVDSVEVPSGLEAFTRGRHIFFGDSAFDPDSAHGEHVIAHELAHIAQQSRPMVDRMWPTRAALEADAHQAALAALAGRAASVNLFAPSAAALGFSNGEAPAVSARGSSGPSRGSPPQSTGSTPPSRAPSSNGGGSAIARPSSGGGKSQPRTAGATPGAPPSSAVLRRGTTGDGLHVPEAPSALTPAAADRLRTVQTDNQGNAAATTTLPTGQQQTDVGRAAVEEPQAEQDARAQHGVVTEVDDRPPPSPEIEQACARIRQVIRDKRPPSEDKLVDAKPREMAQEAGNQMSAGVQERTDSVRKGYSDMQQPPPGSPSSTPVPPTIPPERAQTQAVDAGTGAPDPLKPDDVSLDADVADQKKKIEDAGMNTEPGKLVKDGPIGDARGGVDDLQNTARTDPQKVLADQAAAIGKAKGDMRALQQAADKALADARAGAVDQMATHTTGVKGSEEQQRAQAGEKMKAVFDRTQKSVDALLQPLSGDAVARWDAGVAQLSTEFEASLADVKRRIDERHSGVGGLFTSAWDWATGLPDWVTEGYDRAEAKFGDGATNLIRDISRDVNKVIEDCKQIIQQARKDIDAVVKSLPASLQTWAQGEAAKLNGQLDALDKRVDQTQKGINKDLIGRANGAVQQVREQVADLREKAKGAIAKVAAALVEFAKNPFKAIVNGLLHILGIPPDSFWSMVDRLGDVVGAIAKDPVKFGKTLISGAAQGFKQFFEHFPTHLKEILMGWLFGTMGTAGVPMPTDFSGPGIMPTVLGIIGIDTGMISSMLGADVSDPAEMAEIHQELSGVLSGDPHALIALFREHFDPASLIPMIREAAMSFLIQALIMQVAPRIAAMLVPGGAILQAVEAIFKVLMWVIMNAARIFTLIESLVATAGQAVAGNISGVAAGVESALVQIIVLVIDFLASYLGLGGLGAKLKGVIMKVSGKLKSVLKKVLDAIKKRAKARAKAKHHPHDHVPGQQARHGDAPDAPSAKPKHMDDHDGPSTKPKKPDDHDGPNAKPKNDKNKDKDKDKDKKKDPKRDQAAAKRAAEAAARKGWSAARREGKRELMSAGELRSHLARAAKSTAKAKVTIKPEGTGDTWTVDADAVVGKARASAKQGKGWIAKGPAGQFYAAENLTSFNKKLIADTFAELKKDKDGPEKKELDAHKVYDELTKRAQTLRSKQQGKLDNKLRGLKLDIEMEPWSGVEKDEQVKTKISITPNTAEDEQNLPLDVAKFAKRFQIVEPTKPRIRRTGSMVKHLKPDREGLPMLGAKDKLGPGYAVNITTIPKDTKRDMAKRFFIGAWKGGDEQFAKLRTGVAIGINSFQTLDDRPENKDNNVAKRKEIDEKTKEIAHEPGTVLAAFGFMWDPTWTDNGAETTVGKVREEWKKLKTKEKMDLALAETEKKRVTKQDYLPYGNIRSEVIDKEGAQVARAISSKHVDPVHIVTQDADGDVGTKSGKGVLAAYDEVLAQLRVHPLLTIGGYHYDGFQWEPDSDPHKRQLTILANEIDRAVRAAISAIAPEVLYPTEPNMLVKGIDRQNNDGMYDRGITGAMGPGAAEGRHIREALVEGERRAVEGGATAHPNPIVYAPEASVESGAMQHSRTRGFSIFSDTVDPRYPSDALINQDQSYAGPVASNREIAKGLGLPHKDRTTGQRILAEMFDPQTEAARIAADPSLSPEERARRIQEQKDRVSQETERLAQETDYADLREKLELAKRIVHAIIDTLGGDELREKWSELHKILVQMKSTADKAKAGKGRKK
jgi:hypothetical protein